MKADKAKVVLTDYVWESLDTEQRILGELAVGSYADQDAR